MIKVITTLIHKAALPTHNHEKIFEKGCSNIAENPKKINSLKAGMEEKFESAQLILSQMMISLKASHATESQRVWFSSQNPMSW